MSLLFCRHTYCCYSVVEIIGLVIIAVVKSGSKLTDYDWDQHLSSCLDEAENFQPPSEIFAVR